MDLTRGDFIGTFTKTGAKTKAPSTPVITSRRPTG